MSRAVATESVQIFANKINARWQKATSEIMEVAKLCVEAKVKLDPDEKRKLIQLLPFGESYFSKLVSIGSNPGINAPAVKQLLPPNFSTIYEVSLLTDGQLQRAIEAKILNPALRREDLIKWRKNGEKPDAVGRLPLYAHVQLTKELTTEEMEQLRDGLDQLGSTFALKISRPEDFFNKRLSGYGDRVLRYMRKEARKIVQQKLKNRAKAVSGRKKKNVGFYRDEISIDESCDESRILEVLQCIGREDEFEGIRLRALGKYPMTGPYQYWPSENQFIDSQFYDEFNSSWRKKRIDPASFADFN